MKSKAYCFSNASDYDIEDISEEVTMLFSKSALKALADKMLEEAVSKRQKRDRKNG